MKKLIFGLSLAACALLARGEIKVSDVEVFSGYPWKEVVVGYTVTGTGDEADFIRVTATDKSTDKSYNWELWYSFLCSEGRHVLRLDASADGAKFDSEEVVFAVSVVKLDELGVQLWEGGPYFAECNVGATKPEEYGYYFWWGDTVGYKHDGSKWSAVDGSFTRFMFGNGNCSTWEKTSSQLLDLGYIDTSGNLTAAHDAATAHLGSAWRIPTKLELLNLSSNCTTTWMTRNGVYGRLVTGKGAYSSKSIFLPAAGYAYGDNIVDSGSFGFYESSTPTPSLNASLFELRFGPDDFKQSVNARDAGLSIRPVRVFVR